ncbi:hypothetical protein MRX96_055436 [Rhipicephalus microplus]
MEVHPDQQPEDFIKSAARGRPTSRASSLGDVQKSSARRPSPGEAARALWASSGGRVQRGSAARAAARAFSEGELRLCFRFPRDGPLFYIIQTRARYDSAERASQHVPPYSYIGPPFAIVEPYIAHP